MTELHTPKSPSHSSVRRWLPFGVLLGGLVLVVAAPLVFAQDGAKATKTQPDAEKSESFSKYVDAQGNISLPEDFETEFAHIGTVAVESKRDKPVDELHVSYARKEDVKAFQKDGKFPDGAVLVKTVYHVNKEKMTSGQTSFAKDVNVWFVMIKDAKGRFPDNDLWGSGWGWALYEGGDRKTQVAEDYRTECRTCHIPAKKNDWIFTQCYPLLKKIESTDEGDK
jgi:hypothetical protein